MADVRQRFSSKTVRGAVIHVLLRAEGFGFGFGSAITNCRGCHTVGRLALTCLCAWELPQSSSFVRGGQAIFVLLISGGSCFFSHVACLQPKGAVGARLWEVIYVLLRWRGR